MNTKIKIFLPLIIFSSSLIYADDVLKMHQTTNVDGKPITDLSTTKINYAIDINWPGGVNKVEIPEDNHRVSFNVINNNCTSENQEKCTFTIIPFEQQLGNIDTSSYIIACPTSSSIACSYMPLPKFSDIVANDVDPLQGTLGEGETDKAIFKFINTSNQGVTINNVVTSLSLDNAGGTWTTEQEETTCKAGTQILPYASCEIAGIYKASQKLTDGSAKDTLSMALKTSAEDVEISRDIIISDTFIEIAKNGNSTLPPSDMQLNETYSFAMPFKTSETTPTGASISLAGKSININFDSQGNLLEKDSILDALGDKWTNLSFTCETGTLCTFSGKFQPTKTGNFLVPTKLNYKEGAAIKEYWQASVSAVPVSSTVTVKEGKTDKLLEDTNGDGVINVKRGSHTITFIFKNDSTSKTAKNLRASVSGNPASVDNQCVDDLAPGATCSVTLIVNNIPNKTISTFSANLTYDGGEKDGIIKSVALEKACSFLGACKSEN